MGEKLTFVDNGAAQNVMSGSWRLGAIGIRGGERSFMCMHGAQDGHCYSSAELRAIADKIDGLEGEGKETVQYRETGRSTTVDVNGKYFGCIDRSDGRLHFARGASPTVGASGDDLRQVATKCDEIARKGK